MTSVSVIIPVYNGAKTIKNAIDSVIAQSYKATEIIIVDDGSTDTTNDIQLLYKGKIKYIRQNNLGPSAARNRGIGMANSDWIAFLDADDEWLTKKLELQVEFIRRYPDVGLIFTASKTIYDEDKREKVVKLDFHPHQLSKNDLFRKLILNNFITPCSSVLCKKTLLEKVNCFDTKLRYSEDWDLWLRLSRLTRFGYISKVLVNRSDHAASASRNVIRMSEAEINNVQFHIKYIENHHERSTLKKKALFNIYNRQGDALLHNGNITAARKTFLKILSRNPLCYGIYVKMVKSMLPEKLYLYIRKLINNNRCNNHNC